MSDHAGTAQIGVTGLAVIMPGGSHFDALRRNRLPAALIQGLRDAHTYQRVDREGAYHIRWASDRMEVAA